MAGSRFKVSKIVDEKLEGITNAAEKIFKKKSNRKR